MAEQEPPPSKRTRREASEKEACETKEEEEEEEEAMFSHWLMKSEPKSRIERGTDVKFDIGDLEACPNQTASWEGVRNYKARNALKQMKIGQHAFFYHSNIKDPGIAGIIKIVKGCYPDPTQFDPESPYYDRRSRRSNPRWFTVDVQLVRRTRRYLPLTELKQWQAKHKRDGGPLQRMALFTTARLSVQPVTEDEWNFIVGLEGGEEPAAATVKVEAAVKAEAAVKTPAEVTTPAAAAPAPDAQPAPEAPAAEPAQQIEGA